MNDPTKWISDEQVILWDELGNAVESAINGVWSMQAANIARRLVEAARLVGPTRYDAVPWTLLAGGVYTAVLAAGGIEADLPDDAEWIRLERLMARTGTTRATAQVAYAATVAAINTDRERNWINGGGE